MVRWKRQLRGRFLFDRMGGRSLFPATYHLAGVPVKGSTAVSLNDNGIKGKAGHPALGVSCHLTSSVTTTTRAAVAQEVRGVVWQQEGCWFDPRAPPPPS